MEWQLLGAVAFCFQGHLIAMEQKVDLSIRQEQQEAAVALVSKQESYNADVVKQALRDEFNQRGLTNFPVGVINLIVGYNKNYAPFLPAMTLREAHHIPSPLHATIDRVVRLPQQKLAISYKNSDLVKIFDRAQKRVVAEFSYGKKKGGDFVVVTPDGRYIITAEPRGKSVAVWDAATYKQISTYSCDENNYIAAVMKNGQVVIGSWGKTVKEVSLVIIYDPIRKKIVRTINLPIAYALFNERPLTMHSMIGGAADILTIMVAEVMPNGNIVIGLNDGMVYIYDITTKKFIAIKEHNGKITTLVVTDRDRLIIGSGAPDNTIAVIQVSSGRLLKKFDSGAPVTSLAYLDNDALSELFVGTQLDGRNSAELVRSWDLVAEPVAQDKSFVGTKSIIALGDDSFVVPIHKREGNFATKKELHILTISPKAKAAVLKLSSSELGQLKLLIAKLDEKAFAAHKNNVALYLDEGTRKELTGLDAAIRACLVSYYNIPIKDPKKEAALDEGDIMDLGHAIACTIL